MVTTARFPVLAVILALGAAGCVPGAAGDDAGLDAAVEAAVDAGADAPADPAPFDPASLGEAFVLHDLAANAPPAVAWEEPADGTLVQSGTPVTFRARVSDDDTAPADLSLSLDLPAGVPPLAADPVPDAGGVLTFTVDSLGPGKNVVTLTAWDGLGASAESAVTVLVNLAPGQAVVTIEPASPKTTDDLVAKILVPAEDPDSGPVPLEAHTYGWLRAGVQVADLTGALVPADRTAAGETWTVVVRAGDGTVEGPVALASVVIDNTPPTAPGISLDPAVPTVASTVECRIDAPAVDADGHAVTYLVRWTVDGEVSEEAGTATTLVLADRESGVWKARLAVKVGTVIGCRVNATDGYLAGPMAEVTATLAAFDACPDDAAACPERFACVPTSTVDVACVCAPGYEAAAGGGCEDVDECASGEAGCPAHSACVNEDGGFSCACDPGWVAGRAGGCEDVDECEGGTATCDPLSDCEDADGGYACPCLDGYSGDGSQPGGCADVDECEGGTAACDAAADCSNTAGGYECSCREGFAGDGLTCEDVDECAAGTHDCHEAADCLNRFGAWDCACRQGFAGDGRACEDVDECALGLHDCDSHAACVNSTGGYGCECWAGWEVSGAACEDVDECSAGLHDCDAHASCFNAPGTYDCTCGEGWEGSGRGSDGCADVDECATGQAVCAADADCANTDGGYDCACRQGFAGDGKVCDDVDECAAGLATCDPAAVCANTDGGYTCTCKPGWTGDGKRCVPG
ncbi:MAG: hypothetical protein FJ087_15595 [Deltaproteobacteria bacterium]|nr:hypothetical protein [Deltaproteobacteria bacterium]